MIKLAQSSTYKNKTIEMSGDLTENAEGLLEPVFLTGVESVTLDVGRLLSINSVGIRFFMNWIYAFKNVKLRLINCPPFFVDQINMVSGFLPEGAVVDSFYVPYYSDATGVTKWVLYSNGSEYRRLEDGVHLRHFSTIQDDQGHIMHPDVLENKYFKFLDVYC